MKESVTVQFKGVNFIVEGYYTEKEINNSYDDDLDGNPDYPAEFEIQAIFVEDSDTNIIEIFSDEDLDEFEESAISILE